MDHLKALIFCHALCDIAKHWILGGDCFAIASDWSDVNCLAFVVTRPALFMLTVTRNSPIADLTDS
jgi:hypothetical protein